MVLGVVIASLLVTLLGRLAFVQLVDGPGYRAAAADARLRTVTTPAVRGLLLDADGQPLAANRTALMISIDPLVLDDQPDGGAAVVDRLGELLGLQAAEVRARITACGVEGAAPPPVCYDGSPLQPAPVAEDVEPAIALQVIERPEAFPGVHAEATAVRAYPAPAGANAAHLLGYLSPVTAAELDASRTSGPDALTGTDLVGRTGLEQSYDADLRGAPGRRTVSVDSRGRVVSVVSERDPAVGANVVTSLDADLQAVTEHALAAAAASARTRLDENGTPYLADAGAAVVMDVTDGSVLALASYPTYAPAVWVGGVTTGEYAALVDEAAGAPLVPRATRGELAPASTAKVVSAAAALESGYGTGPYDCPGELAVGNRTFRNFESTAYGPISLARALEVSCDTVFYSLAYDMWLAAGGTAAGVDAADPISAMSAGWGLGQATGIDLPGEATGRVADRAWRQSYWETTRAETCARAADGYPDVADRTRAAYLTELARENCADGWRLRAGDAVNAAIGQGDSLVTPLQMAVAYAAIANGGTRWQPRVGKAVVGADGAVIRELEPISAGTLPVSAANLDYVRDALYAVPRTGTGAAAFAGFPLDQVPIGAKTGSGEVYGGQTTSWFAAFSDRYVVVMVVEQGGTGGETSGPGVRAILDALYGVRAGQPHPAQSIFPGGVPPQGLPTVPAP